MVKKVLIFIALILIGYFAYSFIFGQEKFLSVLVFSKTEGFRHESIEEGKKMLVKLGKEHGFWVDTTEVSNVFKEKKLAEYNVVVRLNTTGDVLNDAQQLEFNRFIQAWWRH